MVLDGHSAPSVSKNLGIGNTNLIYRWKAESIDQSEALDDEVRQLREKLQHTRRERDILKKSVGHFQPTRVADVYKAISSMHQD